MKSWKIGRFFGIDVYIHWSFWLLPGLVLLSNGGAGDVANLAFLLAVLTAAFVCVVLHEFGHALTARAYGIGTRDITLYPIGGVARLESMGRKPWQEFWIAVAGPAVNVVLIFFLTLGLIVGFVIDPQGWPPSVGGRFLTVLLGINVAMILFNLLPAFPLDGGRVLRSLLSLGLGKVKATRVAARIGAVLAWLIAIGGAIFLGNPTLLVIGLFIFLSGQQELQAVEQEEAIRQRQKQWRTATNQPDAVVTWWLQPTVTVYVYDPATGLWVQEKRPAPPMGGLV